MDIRVLSKTVAVLVLIVHLCIRSADAGAIAGIVQSIDGKALIDVTVFVAENSDARNQTTSPNGIYMVEPPARYRRVTLIYEKPGFISRCAADVENKNQVRKPIVLFAKSELSSLSYELRSKLLTELEYAQGAIKSPILGRRINEDRREVHASVEMAKVIERKRNPLNQN